MQDNLELDIKMLLSALKVEDDASAKIVQLYMQRHTIKEICKILGMSRFKVKRRLDKGLKFIKEMALKEGIIIIRR